MREIRIAARLNHPNVPPLDDSGPSDHLLYYVMPYIPRDGLRERLQKVGRLPLDETLKIARQVASALAYAHERVIVHRDVKPENVLLHLDEVRVADFGIARALKEAADETVTSTGRDGGGDPGLHESRAGVRRSATPRSGSPRP